MQKDTSNRSERTSDILPADPEFVGLSLGESAERFAQGPKPVGSPVFSGGLNTITTAFGP
jgi:hypothetical protein